LRRPDLFPESQSQSQLLMPRYPPTPLSSSNHSNPISSNPLYHAPQPESRPRSQSLLTSQPLELFQYEPEQQSQIGLTSISDESSAASSESIPLSYLYRDVFDFN